MIGSDGARAGAGRTSTVAGPAIKGRVSRRGAIRPLLTLLLALAAGGAASPAGAERATPSGLPVPRWVTIKVDPARARAGPSEEHKVMWIYHARGLPVQVVAENEHWRRICDPEGGLAWVHGRVVDGRRSVMNTSPHPLPLLASPRPNGRVRAYMVSQSVGDLDRCKDDWCRVKVDNVEGWAPKAALWGTNDKPQCRGPTPPPPALRR